MKIRLDIFLQQYLEKTYGVKISRSYVQRLLESGAVTHNDEVIKKKGYTLDPDKKLPTIDDQLARKLLGVYQTGKKQDAEANSWDASEEGIEIDEERISLAADLKPLIIFENDDLVVVNKPPGVSSHPGKGDQGADSMVYQFIKYMRSNYQYVPRAGLLHRLDKDTQGILMFAKNMQTYNGVKTLFEQRNIQKYYIATCDKTPRMNNALKRALSVIRKNGGVPVAADSKTLISSVIEAQKPLELEGFIGKQKANQFMVYTPDSREAGRLVGAKACVSDIYILEESETQVKLLFVPHTGRTHQIRAQARYLNAPVINDRIYGLMRTQGGILGLRAVGVKFSLNDKQFEFFLD